MLFIYLSLASDAFITPNNLINIGVQSAVVAIIAIGMTIVTMTILFAILGKNPIQALGVYFLDPLTDGYSLQEIAVKATPLVMIAVLF